MPSTTLPDIMKGLQIKEFKKPYHFSTVIPVPKIVHDNEVLIKVAVAGYCHTEIMVQNGEFESKMGTRNKLPLIPSHEGTGVVVAIGPKVSNVKVSHHIVASQYVHRAQVGDRVGSLAFKNPCGSCPDCKLGVPKYCENMDLTGVISNGVAAEYMVADSAYTVPLPDNLTFEAAAPLMCAGKTQSWYCFIDLYHFLPCRGYNV